MTNETSSPPLHVTPFPQVSVLDFFIPGFTGSYANVEQLLPGGSSSYARLLCVFGVVLFLVRHSLQYFWHSLKTHLTSTVHLSQANEVYDMFAYWVSGQQFARDARSSIARVGLKTKHLDEDSAKKDRLIYLPWNGSFRFIYKGRVLWYNSKPKENILNVAEQVSISCLGTSSAIVKQLLDECRAEFLKLTQGKTSIFEPDRGSWKRMRIRNIRPISTVVIDEKEKAELLTDIESFLDPETRRWYSQKGILYKKGYLLYGPPGTGKSSLVVSIAGYFEMDIYKLDLSNIDESSLSSLFDELPSKCAVLLEDIDAVDMAQTRERNADEHETNSKDTKRKVSLSALLNALDGVASQEGRLLWMTTNFIEKLDPALIRPGRADKRIELGLARKDTTAQLFSMVYKGSDIDDAAVEKLAADFANEVPEREFSPGQIMHFLVDNRHSPDRAMRNVQEWITKIRGEKMTTQRAASLVRP